MEHTAPNTETVIFQPWPDLPDVGSRPAVDGTFSRLAWLPIVGPTSWLIWGTVAAQVARAPEAVWAVHELGRAHGVNRDRVLRSLDRLAMFRVATVDPDGRWLVVPTCPPLRPRLLDRQPAWVQALHQQTFPAHAERTGT